MDETITAGDTLAFDTAVEDYPASAGWTLTYRLVPIVGGTAVTIQATANGEGYQVVVDAATTATWTAGTYSWTAMVRQSGTRYKVDEGVIEVQPDPDVMVAGTDTRSHARKVLSAIEAVIEKRATKDQEEYSIAGRSLKRTPLPELENLRWKYKREVDGEIARERLQAGLPGGYGLQVRL